MENGKRLGRIISALLLLVAFMLPSAVQFSHFFGAHEHLACKVSTTHLHEYSPDCEICHFNMPSFHCDVAFYPELLLPVIPSKSEKGFFSTPPYSFKKTNTQLRAPPSIS
ncbi:MAG TPA: hypothetical protein VFM69_02350 [Pricia sp.]|nr:hypothetical protein [Pricia sp.]